MTPEERIGFCQNCGKPLDGTTVRAVGPAVYCEPCLEARLSGAPTGSTGPAAGHATGAAGYGPVYNPIHGNPIHGNPVYGPAQTASASPGSALPNPALAAVLGFIPGVGAIYNGQYAKGFAHLMVFAVLVSLSNANGIFGLFVCGWIFYMVIEAHHTARARRDGSPLPNPFGLNDLGERLGFGKSWPSYHPRPASPFTPGAPQTPPPPASSYTPPPSSAASSDWGPAVDANIPPASFGAAYSVGGSARGAARPGSAEYEPVYSGFDTGFTPGSVPPIPPVPPVAHNRFPAGALWLIGLGLFFFLGTTGFFHAFAARAFAGFAFLGLAVWLFLRRLIDCRQDLPYPRRLLRAVRGSAWVFLVGIMDLLNEFHVLGWERSWPLFLMLAGALALAERMVQASGVRNGTPAPASGVAQPSASANPAASGTERG